MLIWFALLIGAPEDLRDESDNNTIQILIAGPQVGPPAKALLSNPIYQSSNSKWSIENGRAEPQPAQILVCLLTGHSLTQFERSFTNS